MTKASPLSIERIEGKHGKVEVRVDWDWRQGKAPKIADTQYMLRSFQHMPERPKRNLALAIRRKQKGSRTIVYREQ
jgi:hypothetical protein